MMRTRGTGDDDEAFYFLPVSGMEGSRYMLSRDLRWSRVLPRHPDCRGWVSSAPPTRLARRLPAPAPA